MTARRIAHRITALLFWTGGVVLPSISQVAAGLLSAAGPADVQLRNRLRALERELAAGRLDTAGFCEQAVGAAKIVPFASQLTAGELASELMAPVGPLPGVSAILEALQPVVELSLVSDYPREWLAPVLRRTALDQYLPLDRAYFTADLGDSDVFERLVRAGAIRPGHTLWVDNDSHRTSAAIRRGIDAAFFIDARSFRRDLGLWALLPQTQM